MILASIHSRIGHFLQRRNQADNFLSLRLSMLFHPSSNTTTHPKVQKKSRFPSHASALRLLPSALDKGGLPRQIGRDVVSESTFGHRGTHFPLAPHHGHGKIFIARSHARCPRRQRRGNGHRGVAPRGFERKTRSVREHSG